MLTPTPRTRRAILAPDHPDLPTFSRPFANADAAARFAHELIGKRRDREYGGAILSRDDGRYVATLPISGETLQVNPLSGFPIDEEQGDLLLPVGFSLHGIYHSHPLTTFPWPDSWSAEERALHLNFFSVTDIQNSIVFREFIPVSYLSGPDGCLIRYSASGSIAEQALAQQAVGDPESSAAADQGELARGVVEGRLLISDIVRLLAAAGDLQVVVTSPVWRRLGKVGPGWRLDAQGGFQGVCDSEYPPVQPLLSETFSSADEAGSYVHRRLSNLPHEASVGVLLKHPGTGTYRLGEPLVNGEVIDSRCSFLHPDAYYRPNLPQGYRIDGLYFAAAAPAQQGGGAEAELRRQFFQPADLQRLFDYRHVPGRPSTQAPVRYGFTLSEVYFCAPDGALLGYSPSHSPAEYALARQVSRIYSGSESIPSRLDSGRMSIGDFIAQVAAAGRLRVLAVSDNWPQTGEVDPADYQVAAR